MGHRKERGSGEGISSFVDTAAVVVGLKSTSTRETTTQLIDLFANKFRKTIKEWGGAMTKYELSVEAVKPGDNGRAVKGLRVRVLHGVAELVSWHEVVPDIAQSNAEVTCIAPSA